MLVMLIHCWTSRWRLLAPVPLINHFHYCSLVGVHWSLIWHRAESRCRWRTMLLPDLCSFLQEVDSVSLLLHVLQLLLGLVQLPKYMPGIVCCLGSFSKLSVSVLQSCCHLFLQVMVVSISCSQPVVFVSNLEVCFLQLFLELLNFSSLLVSSCRVSNRLWAATSLVAVGVRHGDNTTHAVMQSVLLYGVHCCSPSSGALMISSR